MTKKKKKTEFNRLLKISKELVEKLDLIHQDYQYIGIWNFCANHGIRYNGPTYEVELKNLKNYINNNEKKHE